MIQATDIGILFFLGGGDKGRRQGYFAECRMPNDSEV